MIASLLRHHFTHYQVVIIYKQKTIQQYHVIIHAEYWSMSMQNICIQKHTNHKRKQNSPLHVIQKKRK